MGCDGGKIITSQSGIISTHTSRVGCDGGYLMKNFRQHIFLLTHPVWDVTGGKIMTSQSGIISTHTSRVGCDSKYALIIVDGVDFYSHIPCGM